MQLLKTYPRKTVNRIVPFRQLLFSLEFIAALDRSLTRRQTKPSRIEAKQPNRGYPILCSAETVVTIRKLRSIVLPPVRSRLNGKERRKTNKIFAFPLPAASLPAELLRNLIAPRARSAPWKIKRVLPIVFDDSILEICQTTERNTGESMDERLFSPSSLQSISQELLPTGTKVSIKYTRLR